MRQIDAPLSRMGEGLADRKAGYSPVAGSVALGPARLRGVMWQNLWNWTQEESGTTRAHFTQTEGRSGKTLCGRPYPVEKGYPVAVRFCKRCLTKAKALGYSIEQLRALAYVH